MQLVACAQGYAEHKRSGALADVAEKHKVVPGVAGQASHMSIFLMPSMAFDTW